MLVGPVCFTVGLILLISLGAGSSFGYGLLQLSNVAAGVALFYILFPGSRFLGNFLPGSGFPEHR